MIRRIAAIALALAINPALLYAQETAFTVIVSSADVYKGPTNVTPVIGHVPRGTVLPIVSNLGSWVRIAWPEGLDGYGYVHVAMGRLGPAKAGARTNDQAVRPVSAATPISQPPPQQRNTPPSPLRPENAPRVQGTAAAAHHEVGLGGMLGYTRSVGATARVWSGTHIGIQMSITRNTLTNELTADRGTATQIEPAFIYGIADRVTDYVWLRPYVGSAVTFRSQTSSSLQPASDSTIGFRLFGGAECMFASAPQFGVSADLGYRRFQDPIPGFETPRLSLSIAGHWYIR